MVNLNATRTKKELITARCSTAVKQTLAELSKRERISQSEIITKSIIEYQYRHINRAMLLNEEQALFGKYGSNKKKLSVNHKKVFKGILNGKHRAY